MKVPLSKTINLLQFSKPSTSLPLQLESFPPTKSQRKFPARTHSHTASQLCGQNKTYLNLQIRHFSQRTAAQECLLWRSKMLQPLFDTVVGWEVAEEEHPLAIATTKAFPFCPSRVWHRIFIALVLHPPTNSPFRVTWEGVV